MIIPILAFCVIGEFVLLCLASNGAEKQRERFDAETRELRKLCAKYRAENAKLQVEVAGEVAKRIKKGTRP